MTIRRVEFLRAWEDGTWDTIIEQVDVPEHVQFGAEPAAIVQWLERWSVENLYGQPRHRKVVFFGCMNEDVQPEEAP